MKRVVSKMSLFFVIALWNLTFKLSNLSLVNTSASSFPFFSYFSPSSVISSGRDILELMLTKLFLPTSNPSGSIYSFSATSVTFVTFVQGLIFFNPINWPYHRELFCVDCIWFFHGLFMHWRGWRSTVSYPTTSF